MYRRHKKCIQVINYFLEKEENLSMHIDKLVKLIWIADRFHLMSYGRMITYPNYTQAPTGPEHRFITAILYEGGWVSLTVKEDVATCIMGVDESFLSVSDMEVMDKVWDKFHDYELDTLQTMSTKFPEAKHWYPEAFFVVPKGISTCHKFFSEIPEDRVELSKQIFAQGQDINSAEG